MKGKSRKKQKRKVEKVDSKSLQSQVWREGEEEAQFFQHRRMSCDAGNDGIVKEKGTKVLLAHHSHFSSTLSFLFLFLRLAVFFLLSLCAFFPKTLSLSPKTNLSSS